MKDIILTIGTFDGVHQGHQKLLGKVNSIAKQKDLHSIAITFDTHPYYVLHKEKNLKILTPTGYKCELIQSMGIDEVIVFPFTEEFSLITAKEFLQNFIIKAHHPRLIVVGYDSHFGHKREGTYKYLRKMGKSGGYEIVQVPALMQHNRPISSSMIRSMLLNGDLDAANSMLRRPYQISGIVVKGCGLGTGLGFPTANLLPDESEQLIPRSGIYFCKVSVGEKRFFGLTNIGKSPTLKQDDKTEIETHIIDFDQNVYGQEISIEMIKRLRDEKKFNSATELQNAMRSDLATAREMMDHVFE